MIDHLSVVVSDYETSKAFYLQALAPTGHSRLVELQPGADARRRDPALPCARRPRAVLVRGTDHVQQPRGLRATGARVAHAVAARRELLRPARAIPGRHDAGGRLRDARHDADRWRVRGRLRSVPIAAAAGIEVSTHLYPEVSAHLMRVTETAHWLEWQDWADPILNEPFPVVAGQLEIPNRAGIGIEWSEDAVRRFAI